MCVYVFATVCDNKCRFEIQVCLNSYVIVSCSHSCYTPTWHYSAALHPWAQPSLSLTNKKNLLIGEMYAVVKHRKNAAYEIELFSGSGHLGVLM